MKTKKTKRVSADTFEDRNVHARERALKASEVLSKSEKRRMSNKRRISSSRKIQISTIHKDSGCVRRWSSWIGRNILRRSSSSNKLKTPELLRVESLASSPQFSSTTRLVSRQEVAKIYKTQFLCSNHYNLVGLDPTFGPIILSYKFVLNPPSSHLLLRGVHNCFLLSLPGPAPDSGLALAHMACPALRLPHLSPLLELDTSQLLSSIQEDGPSLYYRLLDTVNIVAGGEESVHTRPPRRISFSLPKILRTPSPRLYRKMGDISFNLSCLSSPDLEEGYDVDVFADNWEPPPPVNDLLSQVKSSFSFMSSSNSSNIPLPPFTDMDIENVVTKLARLSPNDGENEIKNLRQQIQKLRKENDLLISQTRVLVSEAEILRSGQAHIERELSHTLEFIDSLKQDLEGSI